jgi:hypothetical protein
MRKILVLLGALLGFGLVPMLMAPTGGLPSHPRFASVGVGAAAPATGLTVGIGTTALGPLTAMTGGFTGAVTGASYTGGPISGTTVTAGAAVNANLGATISGVNLGFGRVLLAGTAEVSPSAVDLSVGTNSANTLRLFSNAVDRLDINSAGTVTINQPTSGDNLDLSSSASGIARLGLNTTAAGTSSITLNATSTEAFCIVNNQTAGADACSMPAGKTGMATVTGPITLVPATGLVIGAPTGGAKGAGTVNATGVYQAGLQVPTFAYGLINGNATCAVSGATRGVASCTRSAAGAYTITLNAGFTATPLCTASPWNGAVSGYIVQINASSATIVSVISMLPSTLAQTDGQFAIQCIGL